MCQCYGIFRTRVPSNMMGGVGEHAWRECRQDLLHGSRSADSSYHINWMRGSISQKIMSPFHINKFFHLSLVEGEDCVGHNPWKQ